MEMEITNKERLGVYVKRYTSNEIDLDKLYNILKKLFNENKIEYLVKKPIENIDEEPIENLCKIKEKTLQKGHDLYSTYNDAKIIQANNRNNTNKAIKESIEYMNKNGDIVGFTFNKKVNIPWFHNKIVEKDHHNINSNNKYSNRSKWYDLYIKKNSI